MLTDEQVTIIDELRTQGCAVVIFVPEELEGASADDVEGRLIELGWEVIFDLKPSEMEEEKV